MGALQSRTVLARRRALLLRVPYSGAPVSKQKGKTPPQVARTAVLLLRRIGLLAVGLLLRRRVRLLLVVLLLLLRKTTRASGRGSVRVVCEEP